MHAVGDDEDYVRSAIKGGFQELGFSDHGPWKYHTDFVSDIRMLPEDLPEYIESIRALKEKYRNQISIKIGLERSGMGFSFMEAFMDELSVTSEPGKGTVVRMSKTIGKGRKAWTTQSL